MCCSDGGLTALERGGGVGGENMCEDLRSGSGNTGMCIPSARSSVTFLTSVLTAYCIKGTGCSLHHSVCQIVIVDVRAQITKSSPYHHSPN